MNISFLYIHIYLCLYIKLTYSSLLNFDVVKTIKYIIRVCMFLYTNTIRVYTYIRTAQD